MAFAMCLPSELLQTVSTSSHDWSPSPPVAGVLLSCGVDVAGVIVIVEGGAGLVDCTLDVGDAVRVGGVGLVSRGCVLTLDGCVTVFRRSVSALAGCAFVFRDVGAGVARLLVSISD